MPLPRPKLFRKQHQPKEKPNLFIRLYSSLLNVFTLCVNTNQEKDDSERATRKRSQSFINRIKRSTANKVGVSHGRTPKRDSSGSSPANAKENSAPCRKCSPIQEVVDETKYHKRNEDIQAKRKEKRMEHDDILETIIHREVVFTNSKGSNSTTNTENVNDNIKPEDGKEITTDMKVKVFTGTSGNINAKGGTDTTDDTKVKVDDGTTGDIKTEGGKDTTGNTMVEGCNETIVNIKAEGGKDLNGDIKIEVIEETTDCVRIKVHGDTTERTDSEDNVGPNNITAVEDSTKTAREQDNITETSAKTGGLEISIEITTASALVINYDEDETGLTGATGEARGSFEEPVAKNEVLISDDIQNAGNKSSSQNTADLPEATDETRGSFEESVGKDEVLNSNDIQNAGDKSPSQNTAGLSGATDETWGSFEEPVGKSEVLISVDSQNAGDKSPSQNKAGLPGATDETLGSFEEPVAKSVVLISDDIQNAGDKSPSQNTADLSGATGEARGSFEEPVAKSKVLISDDVKNPSDISPSQNTDLSVEIGETQGSFEEKVDKNKVLITDDIGNIDNRLEKNGLPKASISELSQDKTKETNNIEENCNPLKMDNSPGRKKDNTNWICNRGSKSSTMQMIDSKGSGVRCKSPVAKRSVSAPPKYIYLNDVSSSCNTMSRPSSNLETISEMEAVRHFDKTAKTDKGSQHKEASALVHSEDETEHPSIGSLNTTRANSSLEVISEMDVLKGLGKDASKHEKEEQMLSKADKVEYKRAHVMRLYDTGVLENGKGSMKNVGSYETHTGNCFSQKKISIKSVSTVASILEEEEEDGENEGMVNHNQDFEQPTIGDDVSSLTLQQVDFQQNANTNSTDLPETMNGFIEEHQKMHEQELNNLAKVLSNGAIDQALVEEMETTKTLEMVNGGNPVNLGSSVRTKQMDTKEQLSSNSDQTSCKGFKVSSSKTTLVTSKEIVSKGLVDIVGATCSIGSEQIMSEVFMDSEQVIPGNVKDDIDECDMSALLNCWTAEEIHEATKEVKSSPSIDNDVMKSAKKENRDNEPTNKKEDSDELTNQDNVTIEQTESNQEAERTVESNFNGFDVPQ